MAEHDELIAILLFFIVVFSALLVINSAGTITGLAVADTKENVLEKVKVFINKLDFLDEISEYDFCILIHMDESTTYSYKVVKLDGVTDVTLSSDLYCGGLENNDFVFSYVSYDAFLAHADGNPSMHTLKSAAGGQNFYVLPSKYIASGMSVKNKEEFESKYGTVFNKYFTDEEKKQFLTGAAKRTPSASAPIGFIYGGAAFLVSVILLILLVPKLTQKPTIEENLQLVTYIKSAIAKGYTEDNIKQSLIGSGWPKTIVDQAMKQAAQSEEQPEEAKEEAAEATTEQLIGEAKIET